MLAALEGTPRLGLGDALGSNVVNLGLVLGIALLVAGLRGAPGVRDRRLIFLVAAPLLVGLLILDGQLSRLDAFALLGTFLAWLAAELRSLVRSRARHAHDPGDTRSLLLGSFGLLLLFGSGELIVRGATEMALWWEVDAYAPSCSCPAARAGSGAAKAPSSSPATPPISRRFSRSPVETDQSPQRRADYACTVH